MAYTPHLIDRSTVPCPPLCGRSALYAALLRRAPAFRRRPVNTHLADLRCSVCFEAQYEMSRVGCRPLPTPTSLRGCVMRRADCQLSTFCRPLVHSRLHPPRHHTSAAQRHAWGSRFAAIPTSCERLSTVARRSASVWQRGIRLKPLDAASVLVQSTSGPFTVTTSLRHVKSRENLRFAGQDWTSS